MLSSNNSLDQDQLPSDKPLKKTKKLVFKTDYRLKLPLVLKIFVMSIFECSLRQVLLYMVITGVIQLDKKNRKDYPAW